MVWKSVVNPDPKRTSYFAESTVQILFSLVPERILPSYRLTTNKGYENIPKTNSRIRRFSQLLQKIDNKHIIRLGIILRLSIE